MKRDPAELFVYCSRRESATLTLTLAARRSGSGNYHLTKNTETAHTTFPLGKQGFRLAYAGLLSTRPSSDLELLPLAIRRRFRFFPTVISYLQSSYSSDSTAVLISP